VTVSDRVGRNVFLTVPTLFAVLVALSRVYDGVHYPSDVIAGLLMGAGAVAAALYVTDLGGEFRAQFSSGGPDEATAHADASGLSRLDPG
jgi:membrane-associated phospholipid phosphatase